MGVKPISSVPITITSGVQVGSGANLYSGDGSPEGVQTAIVGSLYLRTDGSTDDTLYVKESGSGNTGWIAKTDLSASGLTIAEYQIGRQANVFISLPNNTNTAGYVLVTSPGVATADIGDILYDDGSSTGEMTVIPAEIGRIIFVTANLIGGIITADANYYYEWDGADWIKTGDTANFPSVEAMEDYVENLLLLYSTTSQMDTSIETAVDAINSASFGITIDGAGSPITTGYKGFVYIPYDMEIEGWTLLGDVSGSIVIDVWKSTYANYEAISVSDTIAGSEKPTLSSSQKNQDLTITTWDTSVTTGEVIAFNVDSVSTVTKVNLVVFGVKT